VLRTGVVGVMRPEYRHGSGKNRAGWWRDGGTLFKLESHVGQGEAFGQRGLDLGAGLLGLVQGGLAGKDDVGGGGRDVGGHVPQVQVVDVHDPGNLPDRGQDQLGVQSAGDPFHQDVGGLAQQSPTRPQDQDRGGPLWRCRR